MAENICLKLAETSRISFIAEIRSNTTLQKTRERASGRAMHSLYISAHSTTPLLCPTSVRAIFRGHRSSCPHLTFMDSVGGGKFVVPLHANFLASPQEKLFVPKTMFFLETLPRSAAAFRSPVSFGRPPTTLPKTTQRSLHLSVR